MHEDVQAVETTHLCLFREDAFSKTQRQNVVWVYNSKLEESSVNDCNEFAVDYVADVHGRSVLELPDGSVVWEKGAGRSDLGDFISHHEESDGNKGGAQESGESKRPQGRSFRARLDACMLLRYSEGGCRRSCDERGPLRGSEKIE